MSRHRAQVRPRYGRIAMLCSSLAVTTIAVLGGTGIIPTSPSATAEGANAVGAVAGDEAGAAPEASPESSDPTPEIDGAVEEATDGPAGQSRSSTIRTDPSDDVALPADSGTGRRVVFSEGRQRVWLVGAGDEVERTYLVSGSIYDNLDPGTYSVYSRSEHAYGIDDSGTMRYFVRFTQGERAAIGFHDIPVDDGKPVQRLTQLGTPLSHGCIRQRRADAVALWEFAPLGTTVVVTA
ncbi:L,D-transpeptidase family protein [Nocardioides ferulae]|uniref:L,D-transpeptidase family protein n=1 Tax=Nocardioides ferulae TaxID=2340821 RepID=UPI000F875EEF|nr:L,D-transpeptidase family protein [Nocardioides ferulae]